MDERRVEQALSELKPPDESPDFFERLSRQACVEYEARRRRLRLGSAVVRSVGAAAGVAACWVLAFGSPFVDQASGGRISLAALKIVDRTVICHTTPITIPVSVSFANYLGTGADPYPGTLTVGSGGFKVLAAVQAGPHARTTSAVFVNKGLCTAAKRVVPLVHRDLAGPIHFGKGYNCPLVHRVVIRMRSVSDGPNIVAAFMVVQKERGGAIGFASLDRTGQGGIYTSEDCT